MVVCEKRGTQAGRQCMQVLQNRPAWHTHCLLIPLMSMNGEQSCDKGMPTADDSQHPP